VNIQWLGHSAFEIISEEGLRILIDPFISNNPSCEVELEELKPDLICVTHGHADHFGDALEIADRTGALLIGNHELSIFFSKQGLESRGMNMGGSTKVQNVMVTMLDARHSSDIDFMEEVGAGGSACSFIFQMENGKKIYHAGDTGLFGDMKTVIGDIYKPDIAILPIGDRFTMGPFEAAIATEWIAPLKVIPMHYNTFPIIEQDPEYFKSLVQNRTDDTEVLILDPGQTYME
jgi:L-ascorbate metabolism protein UlaG (beta-lactamase superfamily)